MNRSGALAIVGMAAALGIPMIDPEPEGFRLPDRPEREPVDRPSRQERKSKRAKLKAGRKAGSH